MPTDVIMPALELAQETGKILKWLKSPGESVRKGESLVEIETDKVTVEIEAPASGILGDVSAHAGDVVPVGRTIARVFAPAETAGGAAKVSPLARKLAEQHGVDLTRVATVTGRIEKADVLAHVESRDRSARLPAASPKARRLAAERGLDVRTLRGSGPGGAVLTADVAAASGQAAAVEPGAAPAVEPATARGPVAPAAAAGAPAVGTVWRIMAERMTASWTTAPHFYLVREVNVSRLVRWLDRARKRTDARVTYTDLLVKLAAAALSRHPRANAAWRDGVIVQNAEVNIGLAVAVEDGLVVPVIHRADTLGLADLAARREDVVTRAQSGRLRPADIQGGGFTISNLGMYGVDAFSAVLNPPQAAILAVGRIADRVVAVEGRAAVQPTMVLTLSCDHRALDGARAAQFLGALADLVEEPLALLG